METAFDQKLLELRKHYGLEDFNEDSDSLPIGDFPVTFMALNEGDDLLALIPVAHLTPEALPKIARLAMLGQYDFRQTAGASLSLSPDSSLLVLQQKFPTAHQSDEEFLTAFEQCIAVAGQWRDRCAPVLSSSAAAAPAADDSSALRADFLRA